MKVILFGASGMVGQGVLRECFLAPAVTNVLSVGRRPTVPAHDKLRDLIHDNFADFSTVAVELTGYDACFFCLGVSSAGMKESDYARVTFDYTLAAARVLAKQNPTMTFIYVSGTGTDSSEQGKTMWARVKGKTENALLKLPFKAAFMFRPGMIQALNGIVSRTPVYRALYVVAAPLFPIVRWLAPTKLTTTEKVGRAMLQAATAGAPKVLLESSDINALAAAYDRNASARDDDEDRDLV